MLDLARLLVFLFVGYRCLRHRNELTAVTVAALLVAFYLFALEVASGITVRDDGPMLPVGAMILVFIGPGGMPRGALPEWLPFGATHVHHPVLPELVVILLLAAVSLTLHRRAARLPVSMEARALVLERAHLGVALCAVLAAFQLGSRVLPVVLGGELGNGQVDRVD